MKHLQDKRGVRRLGIFLAVMGLMVVFDGYLVACAPPPTPASSSPAKVITTYHMDNGDVCYLYRDNGQFSCVAHAAAP